MRLRSILQIAAFVAALYAVICIMFGIELANFSIRLHKLPLNDAAAVRRRIHLQFHADINDVSIAAADRAVLKGWFIEPPRSNGESVIILHGIGGNRIDGSGFADIFLSRGFSVLLPDSREHGESGGNIITYGILERDDVRRWVQFLRARAPRCTYLLGESMGAAIGLEATAVTSQLCAVAVESPYATFREISYERLGLFTGAGALFWRTLGRPVIEVAILYTRLRYGIYLPNAEPRKAVEQSSVPALLIAGTEDKFIPMHHAEELEKACPSHCELWIVHGADHGGASTVAGPWFGQRIMAWFQAHGEPTMH